MRFFFLSSADFFSKSFFFEKLFQEYDQSIKLFGSRSGRLIWVQTVCKGFQQMALVGKELRTVSKKHGVHAYKMVAALTLFCAGLFACCLSSASFIQIKLFLKTNKIS